MHKVRYMWWMMVPVFSMLGWSFHSVRIVRGIPEIVHISAGFISGTRNIQTNVTAYKGIPFAAPPLGPLRWKAPQPVKPWPGVRPCKAFGPSPVQVKPFPFLMLTTEFLVPEKPMDEDCLYLNVWTGAVSENDKRPVVVWIYGGGFNTGGAAARAYDGEAMAAKGCIFVSFNYRLGIFGFFSHPDLTKESPDRTSGNYGLLDQIAVLRWVHQNIAVFGGDPDNVTIAGQSAGSMSVNLLLAAPLAQGFFHRAIAESGTLVSSNSFVTMPDLKAAEQEGQSLAAGLKAPSLDQLRAIPADKLFYKTIRFFGPIVDGFVLPQSIPEMFAAGKQAHVPLLTGWNGDEGMVFTVKTKQEYTDFLKDKFGPDAPFLLKFYPASTDEEAAESQLAMSRDRLIGLPHYLWASKESASGNADVFVYNFTRKPPPLRDGDRKYGAFHTAEIPYFLDNLKMVNRPWEKSDYELASTLSGYWINFVRTGNPNGSNLPEWPAFNNRDKRIMILNEPLMAGAIPNSGALDFFEEKNARKGGPD